MTTADNGLTVSEIGDGPGLGYRSDKSWNWADLDLAGEVLGEGDHGLPI